MDVVPINWSVVLVGSWNPAILTPSGIAKKLYRLESGLKLEIEVPLDGLAPHRVRHPSGDFIVTADNERIRILLEKLTFDALAHAQATAVNALESLPETPVSAMGINVDFKITDPPQDLIAMFGSPIDGKLSDLSLKIISHQLKRAIEFKSGVLNIILSLPDRQGPLMMDLNFHKSSAKHDELKAWGTIPAMEIEAMVQKITKALNLDEGNTQ